MTRIIQDSDDSDDGFDEVVMGPAAHVPMAQLPVTDLAFIQQPEVASLESGTGSTDSLKKAIEAAHRSQFQSQSLINVPSRELAPDSSLSLPGHRDKRRKTSVERSQSTTVSIGSIPSKPAKTYGRARSMLSSPFLAQGDPLVFGASASAERNIWGLEGSMRDQYAEHDPMALFPEQSSTVPNATATQQRLMAEIGNTTFFDLGTEAPGHAISEQPTPSVPWSDFMHETPSGNFEPVLNSPDSQKHIHIQDRASAHVSHARTHSQTSQKSQPLHIQPSTSPHENEIFSTPKSRTDARSSKIVHVEGDVGTGHASLQTAQSQSGKERLAHHNGMTMHDQGCNSATSTRKPGSPNAKGTSKATVLSDDYSESLDLPKEQYKPRPSRSRSSRIGTQEFIDYSVRPENVGKRTSRRSKTVGGASSSVTAVTPRRVQQICEMGFTPSTTQRALVKNNGNVSQSIDWLIRNRGEDEQDELAPSPQRGRKGRNTRKKDADAIDAGCGSTSAPQQKDQDDLYDILDGTRTGETIVRNKVTVEQPRCSPQVVICNSKLNGSTSPANAERQRIDNDGSILAKTIDSLSNEKLNPTAGKKTTLDQPDMPTFEQEVTTSKPLKEKKRRRGRPRKDANPVPLTADIALDADDAEESNIDHVGDALKETRPNEATASDDQPTKPAHKQTKILPTRDGAPPAATPPANPIPAGSTRTPEEQTKIANAASSALATTRKGKVSYRVGLSKRQRIAPLLKVMKK
ncbi:hypothetical protein B0J11DRAFT_603054 [Dendryphion nanum]|uniref:UBA domain-containing protein n=1 Tax=Dendryphion nanum TaxID=256645 RepID=A0A9P9E502_9PLEO|nr:hypothetical protein B0J11DRAFT_603054 [Dendryphion nanum]